MLYNLILIFHQTIKFNRGVALQTLANLTQISAQTAPSAKNYLQLLNIAATPANITNIANISSISNGGETAEHGNLAYVPVTKIETHKCNKFHYNRWDKYTSSIIATIRTSTTTAVSKFRLKFSTMSSQVTIYMKNHLFCFLAAIPISYCFFQIVNCFRWILQHIKRFPLIR